MGKYSPKLRTRDNDNPLDDMFDEIGGATALMKERSSWEFKIRTSPADYKNSTHAQSHWDANNADGYIYAFQLGPFTKVGRTSVNPESRKNGYSVPFSMRTLLTLKMRHVETYPCERYAHYLLGHYGHKGEWFVIPHGCAIIEKVFAATAELAGLLRHDDEEEAMRLENDGMSPSAIRLVRGGRLAPFIDRTCPNGD